MGTITILNETTKNPITLMGQLAGVCYNSDTQDGEKNYKRGIGCMESGHYRVAEFPHVWMIIEGYSARVMREYMRHVGDHLSCLQASTRYIDYSKDFKHIIPPKIDNSWPAAAIYRDTVHGIKEDVATLIEAGFPQEDVANLLPLGMATTVVDCKNLRVLMDMSHTRMCATAYWEFRKLFNDICKALSDYSEEWKYLVDNYFKPKCEGVYGYCNEGKRTCGRRPLKEEYEQWYSKFLQDWKSQKLEK